MRNRVRAGAMAAACVLAMTTAAPVLAAPGSEAAPRFAPRPAPAAPLDLAERVGFVPGVLMVTTTSESSTRRLTTARGRSARALATRIARVEVAPGTEAAAQAQLAEQPGVVAVERALRMTTLGAPDDTRYPEQWSHQLTGMEQVWDEVTGDASVVVAVLDDGVDARHPDLVSRVKEQRAFAGGTATVRPTGSDNRRCDSSHGTHVAGIVGAAHDGAGVVGVLWDVSLLDYAVFTSDGAGGCGASEADVVAAMDAAVAAGADVINLSLGSLSSACSTAFQTAVDSARAAGAVVVGAAGNSQLEAPGATSVPASCNGVISVGAAGTAGQPASYSAASRTVDLVAPGGDGESDDQQILSTVGARGYDSYEGTSMAAPYVAGMAGLLRALVPGLSPDEVEGLLEAGAEARDGDGRTASAGWGLVHGPSTFDLLRAGKRPKPGADPDFPVGGGGNDLDTPTPGDAQVFRVSAGTGRTDAVPQAVAMSRTAFEEGRATHAVLARADVFADALTGSSLGLGLGPLLFSGSTGPLPAVTREELQRTLPPGATVYLLGGPAALPETLEVELRGLGFAPKRLAGATREATAVVIARELAKRRAAAGFPDNGVVLLATSGNWPDAVAAGSLAAYYGLPLLVTPSASLHPAAADGLRELAATAGPQTVLVLGGPTVITEQVRAQAAGWAKDPEGAVRLAGSDRYGTAIAIATFFEEALGEGGVSPRCVIGVNVVRPDGWAHALSASPLAGAYGCVMVPFAGSAGDSLPEVTRRYVQGFGIDGVLAGDTDVLNDAAAAELEQLIRR